MKHFFSTKNRQSKNLLPTRLIIAVVCALCCLLLGSAVYTCTTLLRLRSYYFSNRGYEIASSIDAQARGPGRRNNPEFWQSLLDTNYATYSKSVAFLALADRWGNVLAAKGNMASEGTGEVYVFEESLSRPRNRRHEVNPRVEGWRIRVGLYSSSANYIRRQAVLQVAVSGLAAAAIFVLSIILLRTLNRFLALKVREGAEAQLKSLGIMAASLAHEIRNPLGAMKGLTQLAQEDLPPEHVAQSHLQTVVSEAKRLEQLVAGLLDFARTKDPAISEFSLKDLLGNIESMLKSRLESSGVALQLPSGSGPLVLRSDPAGLRQVLLNIVINAIDTTPRGGIVTLTAVPDERRESVAIHVDDSGPGFGDRSPDELLQPFVTTKARGTGLGLAISKQIVENLGGSLTLQNRPQGGARCSIFLPRAYPTRVEESPAGSAGED